MWRARQGAELHIIFRAFNFLSNANVDPDELHVLQIGATMYFAGSVLWLLIFRRMTGSPTENRDRLWALLTAHYAEHKVTSQFSNLDLNSFCNPSKFDKEYPKLKGKGGEIKHVIKPLYQIWQQFGRPAEVEDERVSLALKHLCDVHDVLDEYSTEMFLPVAAAKQLQESVQEHLLQYSHMAKICDGRGDMLFTVAPKHHMMTHWAAKAMYLNPRRVACFMDEDMVGIVKSIVQGCTSGSTLDKIASTVTGKHRWGLHFRDAPGV